MGTVEYFPLDGAKPADQKIFAQVREQPDGPSPTPHHHSEAICTAFFRAASSLLPAFATSITLLDPLNQKVKFDYTCSVTGNFAAPLPSQESISALIARADQEAAYLPEGKRDLYPRIALVLNLGEETAALLQLFMSYGWRPAKADKKAASTISILFRCATSSVLELEKARAQYDEMVVQTEKLTALGRMAAGIAHEINNPLTGILLFSSSMANKLSPSDPHRGSLDVIIEETVRCRGILKDLLEFSRGPKLRRTMSDPNTVIARALSLTENQFRLKRLNLETDLDPSIPEILLDEAQIEQMMLNLLINSAEATPAGGKVLVKSALDIPRGFVRIEVSDTGCGIPAKDADKIFEPFFSTKEKGTGLGLSVSYGIVKHHKGKLRYHRPQGWSSRFTVELPLMAEGDRNSAGNTNESN